MTSARHEAQSLIQRAPVADGWRFDPVALVAAVNSLVGLDDPSATALLRDLLAPGADATRVGLVARLLFEPRAVTAPLPPPPFGRPDVPLPAADLESPFLPLATSLGLPFLLVGGYRAGGAADLAGWLERCAAAGRVRDQPLRPRASPADAVDALMGGELWAGLVPAEHRPRASAMVRGQALRAAGAVPEAAEGIAAALAAAPAAEAEQRWRAEAGRVRMRDLKWDEDTQRFR